MIRLDKYLCEMNIGTRSQVKAYLRQGLVTVNGGCEKKADCKIDAAADMVSYKGEVLSYKKYAYYMLNKPAGVVSATRDNMCKTVTELLHIEDNAGIFPVGRLDKDTEGLLLVTNDGMLAHNLLSPKKHVNKVYEVKLKEDISEEDMNRLKSGVDIGGNKLTLPAGVERLSSKQIRLTIKEGRFHQIKRMLHAVGNEVVYLKRIAMGSLVLDENLAAGEYRELTQKELEELMQDKSG